MAKGFNKVLLLGNVGKDPEIRATGGGTTVATFGLATAERTKDQQGNWVDKTEWHNVVAYGRTAEIVRDYVKKGKELFIEGRLQTRSWDDKESGQKKSRTEIIVSEMTLLGGGARGEGGAERTGSYANSGAQSGGYGSGGNYAGSRANTSSGGYAQQQPANDYADQGITDEDIPF